MATAFYYHKNFCGERARVGAVTRVADNIKLFPQNLTNKQRLQKHKILSWFDAVTFEYIGVLHGEYILFQNGVALLDRNGMYIMMGTTADDAFARYFDDRMAVVNAEIKTTLVDNWDKIPIMHNVAIASDRYATNYWHFSIEFIPRFRFFDSYDVDTVILPDNHIERKFQNNLLGKVVGKRELIVSQNLIRVKDPVIAFSYMSTDGIMWLRRKMNISVSNGLKRYYIRRGQSISRHNIGGGVADRGGLAEDDKLVKFLEYFGFQTLYFGGGEYSIDEQVQMLDGAHIILAAHGAHLTNIVYLNPPLTIIEVFGPTLYNACFLSIANALAFNYYGLTSDLLDAAGDMVVDCEKLYEIIGEILD